MGRWLRAIASLVVVVLLVQLAPADFGWLPVGPGRAAAADPVPPPAAVNPTPRVRTVPGTGPTVYTSTLHITEDTVWGPQGSPYVLPGLFVDDGQSLTLLPGTVVKLTSSIVVYGQLLSLGTPGRHVVITSSKDDSAGGDTNGDGSASVPAAGDWGSITVYGRSVSSRPANASLFDYTDMRYGGRGSGGLCGPYAELAAGDAGDFVVANSTFSDSQHAGIYLGGAASNGARFGVYNSRFSRSDCGIDASSADADIVGNTFDGTLRGYATYASIGAHHLRFWFNTLDRIMTVNWTASPGPTRANADVRFNALRAGIYQWCCNQGLADWSTNWWGYDANVLPRCVDTALASGYQPPITYTVDATVCPSGQYKVTGYAVGAVPALTASPQVLPPALREAAAPRWGPVDTYRGALLYTASDLAIEDAGTRVTATRTYRSDKAGSGDAGPGWTTEFSEGLSTFGGTASLSLPDGGSLPFATDPAAGYTPAPGVAAGYATGSGGTSITTPAQTTYQFDPAGVLTGMLLGDPGHRLDVHRTGGVLDRVTGVSGRYIGYTRTGGVLTGVSDSQGRAAALSYVDGRLASVTGVDGHAETYGYDAAGRLTSVTSPSGLVTLAAGYDGDGRVAWLEQAGTGRVTFSYDPAAGCTTATLPGGGTVVHCYDWAGRLVSEMVAGGPTRHVVYDAEGHTVADVRGLPSVPMAGYGPTAGVTMFDEHGDPVVDIDPTGRVTATTFDGRHHPLVTTRPDASTVTNGYDGDGRLTTVTDPRAKMWRYTFNGWGEVTGQTDPLQRTRTVTYTAAGDLATSVDETGASTTYTVDEHGWPTVVTDQLGHGRQIGYTAWGAASSTTTARGAITTYAYDIDRRMISITAPTGGITRTEYDTAGRVSATVDPSGGRTVYGYDALGRLTSTTNAAGYAYLRGYTPEGWLGTLTDPAAGVTTVTSDPYGRPIRVTDALGQVTQTVYDRAGRTVEVDNPDGAVHRYAYDRLGRPTGHTTPLGWVWSVGYDPAGNVTSATDPLSNVRQWSYDDTGRLATGTDPRGTVTSYAYDDTLRRVTVTDALGTVWATTRDAAGRISESTDGAGAVTSYGYDLDGNRVSVTDPLGHTTGYEYDLGERLTAQVDPLGRRTTMTYNALGLPDTRTYPDATTESFSYDAIGNVTGHMDRTAHDWTYGYDSRGNRSTATDPLGNVTTYGYDALNRVASVTDPTGVVEHTAYDPLGRPAVRWDVTNASWVTTYDLNGNVASQTDPAGGRVRFWYDHADRLSSKNWGSASSGTIGTYTTWTYGYDADSRLTTVDDPNTTTFEYDIRGRTTAVTNRVGDRTTYDYDDAGNHTTTTSPGGHTRTVGYDAAGRVTSATDPLGNTATYGYDAANQLTTVTLPRGGVYTYGYEPAGWLGSQTDPNGGLTTYEHDGEGRTTRTQTPTGQIVTADYDAVGRLASRTAGSDVRTFGYDGAGRLTSASNPGAALSFGYDTRGLLTRSTDAFGDTAYGYDDDRRLTTVTPPVGPATTYTYDIYRGLLATVRGPVTVDYSPVTFVHDPNGQFRSRSWYAGGSNRSDSYTYDNEDRIGAWTDGRYQVSATYTPDGQTETLTRTVSGSSQVTTYGYDDAGRLTSAQTVQGTSTLSTLGYAWDADGNRSSSTVDGTTVTADYDLADRLQSTSDGVTYTHDDDGQLTSAAVGGTETLYGYNGYGELTDVTAPSADAVYQRDPLGRVTSRTSAGATQQFGYVGPRSALAIARTGSDPATTVGRDSRGELLTLNTAGSPTLRASRTVHGDVSSWQSDSTGTTTWSANYDPFGQVSGVTGSPRLPLGYQSRYTDAASGLVDMGFRHYDPATGRFTRADSLTGSLDDLTTLNRYLYGHADPVDYTDPDGHWAWLDRLASAASDTWRQTESAASTAWHQLTTATSSVWREAKDEASGQWQALRSDVQQSWEDLKNRLPEPVRVLGRAVLPTVAAFAVGAVAFAGCEAGAVALTGGAATPLCAALAGAAGGAVYGALTCPAGVDRWRCAGVGAAAGAAAGLTGGATAELGMVASGAIAGASGDATAQLLTTGTVDPKELAVAALTGAAVGWAAGRLRTVRAACEGGQSFAPDTPVQMADGSRKPIGQVKVGDRVMATDPGTGVSRARTVTALHTNTDTDLADLTVTGADGRSAVVHTTQRHPFWDRTRHAWVGAAQLRVGDELETVGTGRVTVTAVRSHTGRRQMLDLTVDTTHTYYVLAGTTPVLVHNCGESYENVALGTQRHGVRQFAEDNGYTHFLDQTRDEALASVRDVANMHPDATIHVRLDGFKPAPGINPAEATPADLFDAAYERGGGSNWYTTEREMNILGRSVRLGNRSWDSIKFYLNGEGVSIPRPSYLGG